MAELKTKQTDESVTTFLNKVDDETKRKDCFEIADMMKKITGLSPKMWGPAIIGFGSYHYKYESGREGDMCVIGFSPRKQNITLYVKIAAEETNTLLEKLGKYKTGKGCLYIQKLSDVNIEVLKKIIRTAFEYVNEKYS
jgi:hypothetical protein